MRSCEGKGEVGGAGALQEFVWVGRLDNLAMSYAALTALLQAYPDSDSLANETAVKAIALFDNEEVGSQSAQGALALPLLPSQLCRLIHSRGEVLTLGFPSEVVPLTLFQPLLPPSPGRFSSPLCTGPPHAAPLSHVFLNVSVSLHVCVCGGGCMCLRVCHLRLSVYLCACGQVCTRMEDHRLA